MQQNIRILIATDNTIDFMEAQEPGVKRILMKLAPIEPKDPRDAITIWRENGGDEEMYRRLKYHVYMVLKRRTEDECYRVVYTNRGKGG